MSKFIFAVRGVQNTGKTKTIEKIYNLLKELPDYSEEECKLPNRKRNNKIKKILTINGVKIGIVSEGDQAYYVKRALNCFRAQGCTIIICAIRTRGKVINEIIPQFEEYDYKVDFTCQEKRKDKDESGEYSDQQALDVFDKVKNKIYL